MGYKCVIKQIFGEICKNVNSYRDCVFEKTSMFPSHAKKSLVKLSYNKFCCNNILLLNKNLIL